MLIENVELDTEKIENYISGKKILITGAAGSIGSELVRQLCKFNPNTIAFFDRNETAVFYLEKEINKDFPNIKIVPILGSICDKNRADEIFQEILPDIIYHAAANKHVPLSEENPSEAIYNNIYGTKVILETSIKYKCKSFILVSTDKAVNPSSIMGMSKRVCEILIQLNNSNTKSIAVRFGNVLGSSGSVLQIFNEQIEKFKEITITHPDMERYFITPQNATKLLIQSSFIGKSGDIYMLDMGKPIKIVDLAKETILKKGYLQEEIKIKFTGIRPGEKIYEDLITDLEKFIDTNHPKIKKITSNKILNLDIDKKIEELFNLKNKEEIKNKFKEII